MIPFGIWFVFFNALMLVIPRSARAALYKHLESICGGQEPSAMVDSGNV